MPTLFVDWQQFNGQMASLASYKFPTHGPLFNHYQKAQIRSTLMTSQHWWNLVSRVSLNVMPMHYEFIDLMPEMTKAARILLDTKKAEEKQLQDALDMAKKQKLAKEKLQAEQQTLSKAKTLIEDQPKKTTQPSHTTFNVIGNKSLLKRFNHAHNTQPSADTPHFHATHHSSPHDNPVPLAGSPANVSHSHDSHHASPHDPLFSLLDASANISHSDDSHHLSANDDPVSPPHASAHISPNDSHHLSPNDDLLFPPDPPANISPSHDTRHSSPNDDPFLSDPQYTTWSNFDPYNLQPPPTQSLLALETERLEIEVEKRRQLMEDGFTDEKQAAWDICGTSSLSLLSTPTHASTPSISSQSPLSTSTLLPIPMSNLSPTPNSAQNLPQIQLGNENQDQDDKELDGNSDAEFDQLEDSSYEDGHQQPRKKTKTKTKTRMSKAWKGKEQKGKDKEKSRDATIVDDAEDDIQKFLYHAVDDHDSSPSLKSSQPSSPIPYTQESGTTTSSQAINHGLLAEASALINPETVSLSGLSSDESVKIMASFLTLTSTERAQILQFSVKELGQKFKQIVRSSVTGKRDHSISPKLRRIRQKYDQ